MTRSARIGVALVRTYQVVLGPLMGGMCRFQPSCSEYAAEAFRTHGLLSGFVLALRRVARCHPFGGAGIDPVPARESAPRA